MLVSMPTSQLPIMAICSLIKSLLFKLLTITVLFCLITPFTNALSFNFTSFTTNDNNISYQNAYPANQAIQLTANQRDLQMTASIGRATYNKPMHLWDKASGNLTDFTTRFTFVIDSQNSTSYGDGIAFFLEPKGSRIPDNVTKGGSLALASDGMQLNTTVNRFVAVEFDIYQNTWDPEHEHVGVDINSMQSISNITWWSDIMAGKRNEAWISYNSRTQNLSVAFTGFRNNTTVMQHLSAMVDLRLYLPEWVTFGFSAATGNASAIHQIYSWDFSSSLDIDNNTAAPSPEPNLNRNRRKNRTGLAVGLGVAGALVGGMVLVCLAIFYRKKFVKDKDNDHVIDEEIEDEFERGKGPRKFSYNELAHATDNFKDAGKLGQGGFGGVYKGFLRDSSTYVAIKRVSSGSKQGIKEYASEVKIISRLRHRNLVQLIGWCHDKKELLLVYEFMPNGSLDSCLFTEYSLLTWEVRYKIAQGLASGLLYLHEGWEQCVVHRDIKSSNVLLDSEFNAKLGDFGLARLVDHAKGSQTTVLAGTMGYLAPECHIAGKASKQSDVYSFGIVALEIACGRKPINPKAGEGKVNLVEWVWELYGRGKLLEACDPRLHGEFVKQEMEQLMIVGLWCAHPDENSRPSMQQAIHALNFEAPLPILPLKMPVPTYYAPPLNVPAFPLSYRGTDSEGQQNQFSSYSYSTNSSQLTTSSTSSASTSLLLAPRV
ncbi:L-type lectin-domain containing receptor kinase IX.1-like [Durio zibethinus]|uniref:L-type lectin-domain containing receptor kinase IX.1-like n=1 Tax=Durio zibethinus TaxID=66656 RepID=A0A6P6AC67_DURZI|nr:L-type lectin-domain containing receptor kinase IX.1-like [Durio zibethinus]